MKRTRNYKIWLVIPAFIAIGIGFQSGSGQTIQQEKSFADGSKSLGIPVNSGSGPGTKNQGEKGGEDKLRANKAEVKDIISACSAAAEELAAARSLIEALEAEKQALAERLETEKQISKLLNMIAEGEKKRAIALEETIAMQKELSAANKRLIEKQGEEIIRLQKKKSTLLKRLGDFLIGAAAALILK